MKKRNPNLLSLILLIFTLGFVMNSCSDYGYGGDYGDDTGGDDRVLDANLYGTWTYYTEDNSASWNFKSDGDCIQTLYGVEYDWEWEIVDGQLKLFVQGGTPANKTYKIVGNQLYFWSDAIDDWGLPFTKE